MLLCSIIRATFIDFCSDNDDDDDDDDDDDEDKNNNIQVWWWSILVLNSVFTILICFSSWEKENKQK